MTSAERTLWHLLRRDQLNLHFRRQHPIGPFVLDFYCAKAKLCVEIDGPVHAERQDYDRRRSEWLSREGGPTNRESCWCTNIKQQYLLDGLG